MIYGDDNASEALEKVAIFGSFRRTTPTVSSAGRQAIIRSAQKGNKDALAMAKRLGLTVPKQVSSVRTVGASYGPGGSVPAGGIKYASAQVVATYLYEGAKEAEKVANQQGHSHRHRSRLDLGSMLAAGAGGYGGAHAAEKLISPKLRGGKLGIPGMVAAALPAAYLSREVYRSARSGARKRQMRRQSAEMQTYLKEVKKIKRSARGRRAPYPKHSM